jgi:hypothetical protein
MAERRFKVGDLVRVQVGKRPNAGATNAVSLKRPSGIYEVTRLLPGLSKGQSLYQIRGSGGQPEFVVRESELTSAVHFLQPRY